MVLIDGREAASISVFDRGLQYGDGLFETLAIWRGEALCVHRHLQRLVHGCQVLGIPVFDIDRLRQEMAFLAADVGRGVLKLTVTRGRSKRGYAPPEGASPTRILSLHPWPQYPMSYWDRGVTVHRCRVQLSRNPLLAGLKHLNRLEQVLARRECQQVNCPEGIMLDTAGWVIEGTMSNVFVVKHGQLITPRLSHCGVAGVMRRIILDVIHGQHSVPLRVQALRLHSVINADELFVCNSLVGIWPVQQFGDRRYGVGPITQQLQQELVRQCVVVPVGGVVQ